MADNINHTPNPEAGVSTIQNENKVSGERKRQGADVGKNSKDAGVRTGRNGAGNSPSNKKSVRSQLEKYKHQKALQTKVNALTATRSQQNKSKGSRNDGRA